MIISSTTCKVIVYFPSNSVPFMTKSSKKVPFGSLNAVHFVTSLFWSVCFLKGSYACFNSLTSFNNFNGVSYLT